jgi:hypothetical protein
MDLSFLIISTTLGSFCLTQPDIGSIVQLLIKVLTLRENNILPIRALFWHVIDFYQKISCRAYEKFGEVLTKIKKVKKLSQFFDPTSTYEKQTHWDGRNIIVKCDASQPHTQIFYNYCLPAGELMIFCPNGDLSVEYFPHFDVAFFAMSGLRII